jgi:hypothetical protein
VLERSWKQSLTGSVVRSYVPLDKHTLGDTQLMIKRCALLLERVLALFGEVLKLARQGAGLVGLVIH